MSVHWHDDELEWCPCDEGERAFPEPQAAPVPTIWNDPDNNADARQAGGSEA